MSAPNHQEVHSGTYRVGAEIGRGSFASVYKGQHISSRAPVAIKSVQLARLNKKLLENLEHEITILKKLSHPHIVALIDTNQTPSHFYLIMEYCSLGDLSYFFRKRKEITDSLPLINSLFKRYPTSPDNGLHEDVARHFLKQLASALEFLRKNQLIHRDIKPQNLLLCPPKKTEKEALDSGFKGLWELPVLKLADFGFARILPSTSMAETLCGSPLYMAPEILRLEKYTAKADLWSVGAVLFEMVAGRPPFRAANHVELLKQIEQGSDQIRFPENNRSSPDIKRLIRGLLKKDPTERMSFAEFFNDPVIINDIHPPSKPLDQSFLDENLYISEYIQLGPSNPRNLANVDQQRNRRPTQNQTSPVPVSRSSPTDDITGLPTSKKEQSKSHTDHQVHAPARASPKPQHQQHQQYSTTRSNTSSPYALNREANEELTTSQTSDQPPTPPQSIPKTQHRNHQPTPSPKSNLLSDSSQSSSNSWLSPQQQNKQKNTSSPSSNHQGRSSRNRENSSIPKNSSQYSSSDSSHDPFSRPLESESEYVVVEKRTVEVNSFADELAHSPIEKTPLSSRDSSKPGSISNGYESASSSQQQQQNQYYQNQYYQYAQQQQQGQHRRNSSTRSSASSAAAAVAAVAAAAAVTAVNATGAAAGAAVAAVGRSSGRRHRNSSASSGSSLSPASTPTFGAEGINVPRAVAPERRNSIIYGSSPSNALSRALHMASARIFGKATPNENIEGYLTSTTPPQHQRHLLSSSPADPDEKRLVKHLENMQAKSKVIILFAEVKYRQMIPSDGDISGSPKGSSQDDVELEDDAMILVATEAFALYYKSLSILDKFMKVASQWWKTKCEIASAGNVGSHGSNNSFTGNMAASGRLVELVQWARERFNECLTKADYAQAQINKFSHNKPAISVETTGMAERLIFERALDMSKSAAKLEKIESLNISSTPTTPTSTTFSSGGAGLSVAISTTSATIATLSQNIIDLEDCMMSYSTAVWMFESLLESNDEEDITAGSHSKYSDISIALDAYDRERVIKAVDSVSHRLSIVKKKMAVLVNQQQQLQLLLQQQQQLRQHRRGDSVSSGSVGSNGLMTASPRSDSLVNTAVVTPTQDGAHEQCDDESINGQLESDGALTVKPNHS